MPGGWAFSFFKQPAADESAAVFEPPPTSDPARHASPADDRISGETFDANGNTLTSGGVTYAYDFEDRLLTTSSGATIIYDGDGNRVSETANGATTQFLVDDQTPTGYAQVAEELVTGAITAQFTYGPMRISQRRTTTSFYGYDAGGSVRQLFDNTGTVTDTYAYDAFGNTVAQTGSTVNEFQYRGEQNDASLQMSYLRARYYRQLAGRFLTSDRWEGYVGYPQTLSKYQFAIADPINYQDPSGNTLMGSLTNFYYRAVIAVQQSVVVNTCCIFLRIWQKEVEAVIGAAKTAEQHFLGGFGDPQLSLLSYIEKLIAALCTVIPQPFVPPMAPPIPIPATPVPPSPYPLQPTPDVPFPSQPNVPFSPASPPLAPNPAGPIFMPGPGPIQPGPGPGNPGPDPIPFSIPPPMTPSTPRGVGNE